MIIISCNEDPISYHSDYETKCSFELSIWQRWALWSIVNDNHTLICAPTGSGKTLPAEFAIEYFIKLGKKIIYTSPIKALSNQKRYDFSKKFPQFSFGLLTGDIKDNIDADVLIMTTEILKNNLSNKGNNAILDFNLNIQEEVGIIIYDEAHYFNDLDRGHVWEECFMLQPKNIPMLLMSATLHKPVEFASWLESISKKTVVLAQTPVRHVPLIHHLWFATHPSAHKNIRDTGLVDNINKYTNKLLCIQDETYHEMNYYKIHNIKRDLQKYDIRIKRNYILNSLIQYLKKEKLLPAICFVYSRNKVEKLAKDIQTSLHTDDNKINLVENECQKILMKLPNYKEYIHLPEYTQLVRLLEKGIAFHHSGMLPIFREMVELMFTKGYVMLLFATETFALGLNMPTKTVIFTQLSKFDGTQIRPLYGYEYTQQAGRAGRRGFDTKGVIIHLANLFDLPTSSEYREILAGKPQHLSSKFKISYGLVLEQNSSNIETYTNNSMITRVIGKEVDYYNGEIDRLTKDISSQQTYLEHLFTPMEVLKSYHALKNMNPLVSNKERKKHLRKIHEYEYTHTHLGQDFEYYTTYEQTLSLLSNIRIQKKHSEDYICWNISQVQSILMDQLFLDEDLKCTEKGEIATYFNEAPALSLTDLLLETNYLEKMNTNQIVGLLSIFANIRVSDEYKQWFISDSDIYLKYVIDYVNDRIHTYKELEIKNEIYFNTPETNNDIVSYVIQWCDCTDETECKLILETLSYNTGIFIGDFVKALLKINNIATEIESICLEKNKLALLEKVRAIPVRTLKFVAMNQSLYV